MNLVITEVLVDGDHMPNGNPNQVGGCFSVRYSPLGRDVEYTVNMKFKGGKFNSDNFEITDLLQKDTGNDLPLQLPLSDAKSTLALYGINVDNVYADLSVHEIRPHYTPLAKDCDPKTD